MASTITQVITKAQAFVSDMSAAAGLILAQELEDELLEQVKMLADTEDLTLALLTPTYALDEDILKIWSADYFASATDITPLNETSLDFLNMYRKRWRHREPSQPRDYYIDNSSSAGMLLGLTPEPDTATSGTYPFVRLYVGRKRTLTGASVLPSAVQDDGLYVKGIIYKWKQLRRKNPQDEALAQRAYLEKKQAFMRRTGNRLARLNPTVDPFIVQTNQPR